MKLRSLILALLLSVLAASVLRADDADDIRAVLHGQSEAWNRGDIPGFMSAYWQSDELRFVSDGSITFGWQPTLDRYLRRYPDKAAMGTLTFTLHQIDLLAPDAALVFGKWELVREKDHPWGLFTLTFRRIDGRWLIVSDHTSSARE